jgi:hypothetical protein
VEEVGPVQALEFTVARLSVIYLHFFIIRVTFSRILIERIEIFFVFLKFPNFH